MDSSRCDFLILILGALNFFISGMNTLCNKTIDDTLLTVKNYEAARYGACLRD